MKQQERPAGFANQLRASLGLTSVPPAELSSRRHLLTLGVIATALIVLFAGFLNRAFNIDDPLFIWAAKHIVSHPKNPYGFMVNWYGGDELMASITMNPPGASYYLAIVGLVFGWSEAIVHVAFLLPALAVAVGTYLLAQRYSRRPLLAVALATLTPVFMVSGLAVMSDMLMLALWIFAVLFWIRAIENPLPSRHFAFIGATMLVVVAAFTKYFAVALVPLLLVYSLSKTKKLGWWCTYLAVVIAALIAYQIGTKRMYGHGLLFDAVSYATSNSEGFGRATLAKVFVNLVFFGGCLATAALWAKRLWSWKQLLVGMVAALVITLAIASLQKFGPFSMPTDDSERVFLAAQMGLWAVVGGSLIGIGLLDVLRHRDADSLVLCLWLLGTLAFAGYINWTVNGRSILPAIVPAAILIARRLESRANTRHRPNSPALVLAAIALAGSVAWADSTFANQARQAARQITSEFSGVRKTWFEGHWGFQYYMEVGGAQAIDVTRWSLTPASGATAWSLVPGDVIAVPRTNNTNLYPIPPEWFNLKRVIEIPASGWVATVNHRIGASFYSDVSGPLPFAFGLVKPEQYLILEVRAPSR